MENNEINNIENLEEKEQNNDIIHQATDTKQNLTNEQKLEYITNLIREAERNLEEENIGKTLVRKGDDL